MTISLNKYKFGNTSHYATIDTASDYKTKMITWHYISHASSSQSNYLIWIMLFCWRQECEARKLSKRLLNNSAATTFGSRSTTKKKKCRWKKLEWTQKTGSLLTWPNKHLTTYRSCPQTPEINKMREPPSNKNERAKVMPILSSGSKIAARCQSMRLSTWHTSILF